MNILRRIFLSLLSSFFVFLLFATAFDVGFVRTATHPATVKKLAADSGIYSSVVSNSLKQLDSIDTGIGQIDPSNPIIQKAATQTITPQYVQQQAEAAIDNIYQWLNGQIAQPNFNINLNAQKDTFAQKAASSIQQQLAGLPTCTTVAQVQNFNPLNATCLPRGVSTQTIASEVQSGINNNDFLSQANISATNLAGGVPKDQPCPPNAMCINPSTESPIAIFQTYPTAHFPHIYQLAKKTPFILSLLTILCGLGIIFLSKTWQAGLRHIGISLAMVGVAMLVLAFFVPRVISHDVAPKLHVDSSSFQIDLSRLVNDVTQQIDRNYWYFGGLYTIVGTAAITSTEIIRRRNRPTVAKQPAPSEPPAASG